jgi:hypothetical protein
MTHQTTTHSSQQQEQQQEQQQKQEQKPAAAASHVLLGRCRWMLLQTQRGTQIAGLRYRMSHPPMMSTTLTQQRQQSWRQQQQQWRRLAEGREMRQGWERGLLETLRPCASCTL